MSRSHRRRHSRHRGSKSRSRRGGYSSASTYEMNTLGDANTQYNRVFGPTDPSPSNASVSLQGQRAGKKKKGGYWSTLLKTAIAPLALIGLNQRYGRSRRHRTVKRKH